jgi:hypothetical protein
MKLIDQVKPEVLRALDRHTKVQYGSSYRCIIASFESANGYKDLTIDQLHTLITFLPIEFKPKGDMDLFYGDFILQKEYQL